MIPSVGIDQAKMMLEQQKTGKNIQKLQDSAEFDHTGRAKNLRAVAQEFEALFMNQIMKGMRKTVPESGLLSDKSQAQTIFRDMFDTEVTKSGSRAGHGIGLADLIVKQMERKKVPSSFKLSEYTHQAMVSDNKAEKK